LVINRPSAIYKVRRDGSCGSGRTAGGGRWRRPGAARFTARAGALDELLQSGVLEDVGGDGTDDIQQELDKAGTSADVDRELAAMKAEIGPGSPPQELTSG
jgi:hypothetical protein